MSLKHVLSAMTFAVAILQAPCVLAGDYTVSYAFDGTTAEDAAAERMPAQRSWDNKRMSVSKIL